MNWIKTKDQPAPTAKRSVVRSLTVEEVSTDLLCFDGDNHSIINFGFDVDNEHTLKNEGITHWIRKDNIPVPKN